MSTEYKVRAPTIADIDAVLGVVNAYEVAMEGSAYTTTGELRAGWTADKFNIATDAWLVLSPSREAAGYAEARGLNEPFIASDGYVHPQHHGRGVGTRLVRLIERRAMEGAAASGHLDVQLSSGLYAADSAAGELFQSRGFNPIRYFLRMRRELKESPPAPLWPAGVMARALESADQVDAVYRPMMEIFEDHWRHRNQTLEEWKHNWLEGASFEPKMWFIAEAEGEIVGLSLCKGVGGVGEVSTLGVRRPWRKRGLAMALLNHSFACFRDCGYKQAELSVDSENLTGATRLYQRAGMHEVNRYVIVGKQIASPTPPHAEPSRESSHRSVRRR